VASVGREGGPGAIFCFTKVCFFGWQEFFAAKIFGHRARIDFFLRGFLPSSGPSGRGERGHSGEEGQKTSKRVFEFDRGEGTRSGPRRC